METIKKFANCSTTSSLVERDTLFKELFQVLNNLDKNEIPELAFKVLGKLLYYMFPVYMDKKSRLHLIKFNNLLIKAHQESLKNIISSLETHANSFVSTQSYHNLGLLSLNGIELLRYIFSSLKQYRPETIDAKNDDFIALTKIYAKFLTTSIYSQKKKSHCFLIAYKRAKLLFQQIPDIHLKFESVLKNSIEQESSDSKYFFLLSGLLMQYFTELKYAGLDQFKSVVLDLYVKQIIGTRIKLSVLSLSVSNYFLKYVVRAEFKDKIMPALQRALLRSPENVLEGISYMFDDLKIDLSDFAKELIPTLSKQLIVKSEQTQGYAVQCIDSFIEQCSNKDVIIYILKHLFSVLNGSEGKLTLPIQKNMVLMAVANCSKNDSFSSSECVENLLDSFSDFFKTEVNDLTLHFAFDQLKICLQNTKISSFQSDFLVKIKEFFKKLLENKTFSTAFKVDIYQSMISLYSICAANKEIVNFESSLMHSIEKAQSQVTQNPIFSLEALSASLLLATYLESDITYASRFEKFIESVNESNKQLFTTEKFYTTLSEQGAKTYCDFLEKLIFTDYVQNNLFQLSNYNTTFIHLLFHSNYKIRKFAQNTLKKICNWQSVSSQLDLVFIILEKIEDDFESLNLFNENVLKANTSGAENGSSAQWPCAKGVYELISCIGCLKNLTEKDIKSLALKCLILSNSPLTQNFDGILYERFLRKIISSNPQLNLSTSDLIKSQTTELVRLTTDEKSLSVSQLNSVEVLSKLDGSNYMKKVIENSIQILINTSDLKSITKEQCEIMKLQEGELHDRTLIDSAIKLIQDASLGTANAKKDKNYSYKDQLAEAELRKELEKKKRNEMENKTYTLDELRLKMSKKQQEMLDIQIIKERNIREEMKVKDNIVNKACSIIVKAIKGNPRDAKTYVSYIIGNLMKFLRSPLCVEYIANVLQSIGSMFTVSKINTNSVLFTENFLNSIIFCTLRLSATTFTMGSEWKQEKLSVAFKRLCQMIKDHVQLEIEKENFDMSVCSLFYPFYKYCIFQKSADENCFKNIIESILLIANQRNKLEEEVLEFLKSSTKNGKSEIGESDKAELKTHEFTLSELTNNFMSSNFFKLSIDLLEISNEEGLNINLQYQASETIKALFKYSSQLVYRVTNYTEFIYDNLSEYTKNYILEVKEIIKALSSDCFSVREVSLLCLESLNKERESCMNKLDASERFLIDDATHTDLNHMLWLGIFDVVKSNRILAGNIWDNADQFVIDQKLCYLLADDVVHPVESIRLAASEALADAVKQNNKSTIPSILKMLFSKYTDLAIVKEPKKDQFGRVDLNEEIIDEWEARKGIASALTVLAESVPSDDVIVLELFQFFVYKSLNDRNTSCRNKMLDAAISALNFHGRTHMNSLYSLFEKFLNETPKDASYDSVRQNVVILMGTLAKHLDKDDQKVGPIIDKLIQSLGTPSQQVQEAVSKCLPALVPSIKAKVPNYVNDLLNTLLTGGSYGERRGAAYGLAGILKGVGMLSLRQLNVLQRLNDAVSNKSDAKQREGALLAYEMLTTMFAKVFEPYSVEILPNLLICFGDHDENVRQAADDCAKAIMSNLTFTGVKMILPKLLERLGEEESWRTKCGSVELLGAMAHCAPKQLSTCLPNIVPKLIEVLSDSHVKVQKAGTQALRQIGSVIKNPEILSITNTLLEALQDPALKTAKALQVLLDTKFVHFIDAPSLALIMPVVQRAFQDRSTEIRKMAAQIMGNMYSLTDQKDLLPYLPAILPGLKLSLLDPVPDVRSVSSKALGAMIRAIGENGLNDIIAWLMEKLVSESSGVDRSGAAQGLSEVFGALGVAKLEKSMPEIIERSVQVDLSPFVRDGYIMMFIYLPLTFGKDFTPYIGQIIQPILKALADDCEFVRDTAIKAGQRIVNTYAETTISLLLPELEKGLFDLNWRIRYASVQLLGDLLYKISGVVGKMTTESAHEDDNFGTEKGSISILRALGEERRNRVYSGLYMGRCDVSLLVRQSALHIWKIIVSNTPRTLKEILNTLFNILLSSLASSDYDKRHIAAATMVDIVRKLGERVLPEIIPILEFGLNSKQSDQREGVCIGLTEIMSNTSRDSIMQFSDSLIPTVRKGLLDPLPEVRKCAAKTFDTLHSMIGVKAMDEVVLHLFDLMNEKPENVGLEGPPEWAMDGLKQIMILKSRSLLPYLVPHLTEPPINITAVCTLCTAASTEVLGKVFSRILTTLVNALAESDLKEDGSNQNEMSWVKDCENLLLSIDDDEGVKTIVTELLQLATNGENLRIRMSALDMLNLFCSKTEFDYSYHVDDLIRDLFNLLNETDVDLLAKVWTCLNCVINSLKGNNLMSRLSTLRQCIRILGQQSSMNSDSYVIYNIANTERDQDKPLLPGFCLAKKGIGCLLPIFKESLLNGAPDVKEQSAQTLSDCIRLSDGPSLKSSVMGITGPLIRVLGERYSWTVKSAVLDAIYYLLVKVGVILKPFLPQLQPTFMKNLNDINKTVRIKSGYALSKLIFMNPKLDQVITEIHNLMKNTDDQATKQTSLNALRLCLNAVGAKCQEETKKQLLATLKSDSFIYSTENYIRKVCAGVLGSLIGHLSDSELESSFNDIIDYDKHSSDEDKLHSNCMTLTTLLQNFPEKIIATKHDAKCSDFIANCMSSDRTYIVKSSIRAAGFYFDYLMTKDMTIPSSNKLPNCLAKTMNNASAEVKELSADLLSVLVIKNGKTFEMAVLKALIPMLMNGTKEKDYTVKLRSEAALVNILRLKENDTFYKECLTELAPIKEPLSDCVNTLSKDSYRKNLSMENCILDETILKLEN